MNCKQMEHKILLADSGELQGKELEKLKQHLAECPACHAYQESVRKIVSEAKDNLPIGEPSAKVMSTIRSEAQRRARPGMIFFRHPVVRTLAYAAALVGVISGWLLLTSNGHSDRISELDTIVAMVSEDALQATELANGQEEDQRLRALANRLLLMEGLVVDEFTDMDALSPEFLEPQPTTLRSRSILESAQGKCV